MRHPALFVVAVFGLLALWPVVASFLWCGLCCQDHDLRLAGFEP